MSYGQYVSSVGLYSSEYGLGSMATQFYCANNIVGKPSCYPCSGEDPRVYSLCEFGKWWMTCPSALPNLPFRRPPRVPAQAFIDLKFDEAVIPERLDVLETYESGAIVRIWAWESYTRSDEEKMPCVSGSKWWLLYEGEPTPSSEAAARKVSFNLCSTTSMVNTLRLEMNYTLCKHYPCIDAVLLVGSRGPTGNLRSFPSQIFDDRQASKSSGSDTSSSDHSSHPGSDFCSVDTGASKGSDSAPHLMGADVRCGEQVGEGSSDSWNLRGLDTENDRTFEGPITPLQDPLPSPSLMEGLSSLNICNKVVMHGLQNYVRTKDDILMDGPSFIGSISIENLLKSFGNVRESPALNCDQIPSSAGVVRSRVSSIKPSASNVPSLRSGPQTEVAIESTGKISEEASSNVEASSGKDFFKMLPPEVVLRVLGLLDLRSLCRVAQCCTSLRQLAYHPQLYAHLSLKDWWSVVNDRALASLLKRLNGNNNHHHHHHNSNNHSNQHQQSEDQQSSSINSVTSSFSDLSQPCDGENGDQNTSSPGHRTSSDEESTTSTLDYHNQRPPGTLQSLDLSWCGLYGAITCPMFLDFIHKCGPKLRLLRLSCCDFVDSYCLYMVANVCHQLTELDVARCYQLDFLGLGELKKLTQLTRLDVSYTALSTDTAHVLLQHLPLLRHLCVRGCQDLRMDEVCLSLSGFCPALESLGAWKTRGLTHRGVRALAGLSGLQDLDLGWAFANANSLAGSIPELVQRCQQLVRLRLTACRYLSDADVSAIALHCRQLQQLDLTGNASISADAVESVLQSCQHLQLLEVSYCAMVSPAVVDAWRHRYPSVLIVSVTGSNADVRCRFLHP